MDKIFEGDTVAIVGTAPGVPSKFPDRKVIALSFAGDKHPKADMIFAIDGNFPPSYKGLKVACVPCDDESVTYIPMRHERVQLAPNHSVELRNNGVSAIRLAAQLGAAKIELYGFDVERYEKIHSFPGFGIALNNVIAEMQAQGIEVTLK